MNERWDEGKMLSDLAQPRRDTSPEHKINLISSIDKMTKLFAGLCSLLRHHDLSLNSYGRPATRKAYSSRSW